MDSSVIIQPSGPLFSSRICVILLQKTNNSPLLLLDLSAAFDIVDHCIFIKKLKVYKFSTIQWFSSYLSDRKQIVQVESKFSNPEDLAEYGVPQGSILGPLVFIIFKNYFPDISEEAEFYKRNSTILT